MLPTVVYETFILIPPSVDSVYFARGLLSPDGSMRSEQDRQVQSCILQHVPRRYQNKATQIGWFCFGRVWAIPTGASASVRIRAVASRPRVAGIFSPVDSIRKDAVSDRRQWTLSIASARLHSGSSQSLNRKTFASSRLCCIHFTTFLLPGE